MAEDHTPPPISLANETPVMADVNSPPCRIGAFRSEMLTLGFPDEHGAIDGAIADSAQLC